MSINLADIPWGVWQNHFFENCLDLVDITRTAQTDKKLYQKIFSLDYFQLRRLQCRLYEYSYRAIRFAPIGNITVAQKACEEILGSSKQIPHSSTSLVSILSKMALLQDELLVVNILKKLPDSIPEIENARPEKELAKRFIKYSVIAFNGLEDKEQNESDEQWFMRSSRREALKRVVKLLAPLDTDAALAIAFRYNSFALIENIILAVIHKNEEYAWSLFKDYCPEDLYEKILPYFNNVERSIETARQMSNLTDRLDVYKSLVHLIPVKKLDAIYELPSHLETAEVRDKLRTCVAIRLVLERRFDEAQSCMKNIENAEAQLLNDNCLIKALNSLTSGDTDVEFHLAQLFYDPERRFQHFVYLADRIGEYDLNKAISITEKIGDQTKRKEAYYLALSHHPQFNEIFNDALEFARTVKTGFSFCITLNLLKQNSAFALAFFEPLTHDLLSYNHNLYKLLAKFDLQKVQGLFPHSVEWKTIAAMILKSQTSAEEIDLLQDLHASEAGPALVLPHVPAASQCTNPAQTFEFIQSNFEAYAHYSLFRHVCSSILKDKSISETLSLLDPLPIRFLADLQSFIISSKPFSSIDEGIIAFGMVSNNLKVQMEVLLKISKMLPNRLDQEDLKRLQLNFS